MDPPPLFKRGMVQEPPPSEAVACPIHFKLFFHSYVILFFGVTLVFFDFFVFVCLFWLVGTFEPELRSSMFCDIMLCYVALICSDGFNRAYCSHMAQNFFYSNVHNAFTLLHS